MSTRPRRRPVQQHGPGYSPYEEQVALTQPIPVQRAWAPPQGYPIQQPPHRAPQPAPPVRRLNIPAIASLLCALVGLAWTGIAFGPVAIALGIVGIQQSQARGGRAMSIIGLVVGAIDLLAVLPFVFS